MRGTNLGDREGGRARRQADRRVAGRQKCAIIRKRFDSDLKSRVVPVCSQSAVGRVPCKAGLFFFSAALLRHHGCLLASTILSSAPSSFARTYYSPSPLPQMPLPQRQPRKLRGLLGAKLSSAYGRRRGGCSNSSGRIIVIRFGS